MGAREGFDMGAILILFTLSSYPVFISLPPKYEHKETGCDVTQLWITFHVFKPMV